MEFYYNSEEVKDLTKRLLILAAGVLLAALIPLQATAQMEIVLDMQTDGRNSMAVYYAQMSDETEMTGDAALQNSMKLFTVSSLIEERFSQARAAAIYETAKLRGETQIIHQTYGSQSDAYFSAARVWHGEQANGRRGCSAASLMIDLETGTEIGFDALFTDAEAAAGRMEQIISDDVLDGMSDYMEYAELLPMPRDCFAVTPKGLMVFWPEDRYRYYSGEIGSVTFFWHEIAGFIGEDSPLYEISRPDAADRSAIESLAAQGCFEEESALAIGQTLSSVGEAWPLADPDYTVMSMVYPFERERGAAVEISKYAETAEEDTPVCAVRLARVSWHGLTTGVTTRDEIISLLGEPAQTKVYSEDEAFDMLLDPGETLYYPMGGNILQAHLDEDGVLACLILRDEIPQSLF